MNSHPLSSQVLTSQVQAFYQRFPYPSYPLLAKPRIQEAYLCSADFAAALANAAGYPRPRVSAQPTQILVAGCGAMQPTAFAAWEARRHQLIFLDLSASSLRRARFRQAWAWRRPPVWINQDLQAYLDVQKRESLQHCDAYGVLHHLATPSRTLHSLAAALAPGATLRLMVYNSPQRRWIHELQKILRLFGLSPFVAEDRTAALSLLQALQKVPVLQRYFRGFGEAYKHNTSCLVDTFMHVREIRWPLAQWWQAWTEAGLQPLGLFDRYAELDDLANPLWQMPTLAQLSERCEDGRFENNFEVFLVKACLRASLSQTNFMETGERKKRLVSSYPFLSLSPPLLWFSFEETRGLALSQRWRLWRNFLQHTREKQSLTGADRQWLYRHFSLPTLQRLARLGALLPGMFGQTDLKHELTAALFTEPQQCEREEACARASATFLPEALRVPVLELAKKQNLHSNSKRLKLIFLRLEKLLTFYHL